MDGVAQSFDVLVLFFFWQGSDAADVAHSAKWQCVRVEEPA
jgi:hypothetical protein